LRSRELPPDEWHRLTGTELGLVHEHLSPQSCRVVVVEDDDGQIIGCWSLQAWLHVEGIWIHPAHQKRGGVFRALFRTMKGWVREAGARGVLTGSLSAEIDSFLQRLGASKLPGSTYAWPIIPKE
jgi:acetyltransferase (GNAT) family protein